MTDTKRKDVLEVEYFHEVPGVGYGNIMWQGDYRMRRGRFPPLHPVNCVSGRFDPMGDFRSRGYWASCFPEGDGITMKTERGQTAAQVAKDIEEVFGWRVVIKRDEAQSRALLPDTEDER